MTIITNELGQPIGFPLPEFRSPPLPPESPMEGRYCILEKLCVAKHAEDLFAANQRDENNANWTYLPYGPFSSLDDYIAWMKSDCFKSDPHFHAIIDKNTGSAVGVASYLRIDPRNGSIEIGHINYSPMLQRTPAATESMYLLMQRAFDLGYRRYEWKCDALNGPSRSAALRLGFSYEGVFRQATHYKNRNRDTAWYAIIDSEWPAVKIAFQKWLIPDNFDADGQQIQSLSSLTAAALNPA